jgi:hypothetical protein
MLTVTQERELKRHSSQHYLEDLLYQFLLAGGIAAKSLDLAALLEKEGIKLEGKYLRLVMAESPRFIVEERRWNIALRGEIRRPFAGLVEFALRDYGKPLSLEAMRNEMALVLRRPLEFFDELLNAMLGDDSKYFQTADGDWALREWLLDTGYPQEEELFLRNFFLQQGEIREVLAELLDTRMATDQPAEQMAIKLLRKAGRPLSHKLLSFAIWKLREGDLDSRQLFEKMQMEERALLLSGAQWALLDWGEEWQGELKKLSKKAEKLEDLPWLEEEEDAGGLAVSEQDLKAIVAFIKKSRRAVRVREILESVLETEESALRSSAVVEALGETLARDHRLQRVGAQSWTIPAFIPKVEKVPRTLLLEPPKPQEEDPDAELEDEGLEAGLANWVHDPRHEEIGEEEEVEKVDGKPVEEIRCVALQHHLKAGTLKLRQNDLAFYPGDADPVCLMLRDETGGVEAEVWGSYKTGLLFGLDAWYEARQLQPGSIFAITRGEEPDDYILQYSGELDPLLALSPERLKILRSLKKEAVAAEWSVFEIMCRIMADYDKGIAFLTLWAEVNGVRRTRKRVVASNLSSYHAFSQRPAGTDNWLFDERRVSLGRKKTKRRFQRTTE